MQAARTLATAVAGAGPSLLSSLTSVVSLMHGDTMLTVVALLALAVDQGSKAYVRIQASRTEREVALQCSRDDSARVQAERAEQEDVAGARRALRQDLAEDFGRALLERHVAGDERATTRLAAILGLVENESG